MKKLKFLLVSMVLVAMLSVPFTVLASPASVNHTLGTNFDSTFTHDASGWLPVVGSWKLESPTYYTTSALYLTLNSVRHTGTYRNMTYQVRMRRTGCDICASALLIRGNPTTIGTFKEWTSAYRFQYTTAGSFSIWKIINGNGTALKNWTQSTAILKGNRLNTLKVVAIGSELRFYINNILVWHGRNSALSTGYVGITMFGAEGDKLRVDRATMNPPAEALSIENETVAPGIEVPGGNVNQSP